MKIQKDAGINLIGAFALKIYDLQMDAAAEASGLSPTACACLISVAHQDHPQTIRDISEMCCLAHSSAVRLVGKLEKAGLIFKSASDSDRREIHVSLTKKGLKVRDSILAARRSAIELALSLISQSDVKAIERSAGIILAAMTNSRIGSEQICRHCDAVACGENECPVEKKVLLLEATQ